MRDNRLALQNKLIPILEPVQEPNEKLYDWALAITASFKHTAYDELLRLNLSHNIPKKLEANLSTSYDRLDGLNYMVKVALAGFKYQNIYGSISDFRDVSYKNIKEYSHTVLNHLDYALKEISEFTKK